MATSTLGRGLFVAFSLNSKEGEMPKRINIENQQSYDRLFPVQAFFNEVSDSDFVMMVDSLTQGVGMGLNVANCTFPGDLDPWQEPFDGVMFSLYEDEVVVDIPSFRHFLTLACEAYVREHPEDRAEIAELLARPQPPLTAPGTNVEPSSVGI